MKNLEQVGKRTQLEESMDEMAEQFRHQLISVDGSMSMNDRFSGAKSHETGNKMKVAKTLLMAEAERRSTLGAIFGLQVFDSSIRTSQAIGLSLSTIQNAIQQIRSAGGTSLQTAVQAGLEELTRNPSPIGWNHLVIVTDAEDGAFTLEAGRALGVDANERGITVDVIHIRGEENAAGIAGLQAMVKYASGRYASVDSEESMATAFRTLAHRPLLMLEAGQ